MNRTIAALGILGTMGIGITTFVACGQDTTTPDPGSTEVKASDVKGTTMAKFAVNKLVLPTQRSDFAIDLNGDNHPDNQLGNIIGALTAQNLDAQGGVDKSVTEGSVSILAQVQTADATLKTDPAVGVTLYVGKGFTGMVQENDAGVATGCTGCPDYSGMGMFTIDAAQPTSVFLGKLSGGKFTSNNPVTTKNPIAITLKLALISGGAPVSLIVNGAHLQFTATSDGKLTDGQLHGSIKNSDVQGQIIPGVAMLLSQQVAKDNCMGGTSKQIASIFDTGMCGSAKAGDCKIDACEVAGNSIIMNVLAPDVQIYSDAASTVYAPNKLNTTRDSLSLGIGFTAVTGKF